MLCVCPFYSHSYRAFTCTKPPVPLFFLNSIFCFPLSVSVLFTVLVHTLVIGKNCYHVASLRNLFINRSYNLRAQGNMIITDRSTYLNRISLTIGEYTYLSMTPSFECIVPLSACSEIPTSIFSAKWTIPVYEGKERTRSDGTNGCQNCTTILSSGLFLVIANHENFQSFDTLILLIISHKISASIDSNKSNRQKFNKHKTHESHN